MPLKMLLKFLTLLNSNTRTIHLALGGAFGVLLGLLPANSLVWIVLFLLLFLTKINYGFQVLVMALVKLLAPLFAAALDRLGLHILLLPSLQESFTALADIPLFWLTRYNNSLVMGGLVAGLVLFIPTTLVFGFGISAYRLKLEPLVSKSRMVKALKRLPLVMKMMQMANGQ